MHLKPPSAFASAKINQTPFFSCTMFLEVTSSANIFVVDQRNTCWLTAVLRDYLNITGRSVSELEQKCKVLAAIPTCTFKKKGGGGEGGDTTQTKTTKLSFPWIWIICLLFLQLFLLQLFWRLHKFLSDELWRFRSGLFSFFSKVLFLSVTYSLKVIHSRKKQPLKALLQCDWNNFTL